MQSTTRRVALVPAVQQIRPAVVLLSLLALLALLVLFGAGLSRAHFAAATSGGRIVGTNGDIHIGSMGATTGSQLAASNGDIVIGTTMVAPIGGQTAATTGDVRVGNGG